MNLTRVKSLVRNVVEKSNGTPRPFLGLEHIESGTAKLLVEELPLKAADDSICFEAGDVLFSKLRPYLAKSLLPASSGTGTSELLVLRPRAALDPRFLLYVTLSNPWLEWANTTAYGAKMPRTSWELIADYRFSLPSRVEQRRIADFLDAETARIDQLLSLRRQQESILEEQSSAFVSELLLPGILTSGKNSGSFPWLPQLPADRPLVRLGFVCRLQNGVTVDAMRRASAEDVTLPYLRVANVQSGHVSLDAVSEITVSQSAAKRSTLQPGDVLMTEGGDLDKLGRGAVWRGEIPNCLHQNHIFALRPDGSRLNGDYLALMTQTVHGRCYFESTGSKTTNLASTNSSKILSFPLPLPSVELQRSLVRSANLELGSVSRARQLVERQVDLLAERRQALITAAVTGQFDVSSATGRGITEGVPE